MMGTLKPYPSFGVYLDTGWSRQLGQVWVNRPVWFPGNIPTPYPAIIVDWTDMQVVSLDTLSYLVDFCAYKIIGGDRLDIGCIGSHGRTGTLLACIIGQMEGLKAKQAIKEVRRRHCKHAIETDGQEALVRNYLGK